MKRKAFNPSVVAPAAQQYSKHLLEQGKQPQKGEGAPKKPGKFSTWLKKMLGVPENYTPYSPTAATRTEAIIKPCLARDKVPGKPSKWCLYSKKDPSKLLGRHPSKESARKQEIAIHIHKGATPHVAKIPDDVRKKFWSPAWGKQFLTSLKLDPSEADQANKLFLATWEKIFAALDTSLEQTLKIDTKQVGNKEQFGFVNAMAGVSVMLATKAFNQALKFPANPQLDQKLGSSVTGVVNWINKVDPKKKLTAAALVKPLDHALQVGVAEFKKAAAALVKEDAPQPATDQKPAQEQVAAQARRNAMPLRDPKVPSDSDTFSQLFVEHPYWQKVLNEIEQLKDEVFDYVDEAQLSNAKNKGEVEAVADEAAMEMLYQHWDRWWNRFLKSPNALSWIFDLPTDFVIEDLDTLGDAVRYTVQHVLHEYISGECTQILLRIAKEQWDEEEEDIAFHEKVLGASVREAGPAGERLLEQVRSRYPRFFHMWDRRYSRDRHSMFSEGKVLDSKNPLRLLEVCAVYTTLTEDLGSIDFNAESTLPKYLRKIRAAVGGDILRVYGTLAFAEALQDIHRAVEKSVGFY